MPIFNTVYGGGGGSGPILPFTPGVNTIAYYPLNSTYTNTDQSGNGYNGTTTGTIIYYNHWGEFSSGNSISIPTIIPYGSNPFTISVWCNFSNLSGENRPYLQYKNGTNNTAIGLVAVDNKIGVWSIGSYDWLNIFTISQGAWYNIILTYTGSQLNIYCNTVLKGTKNRTISTTAPVDCWIGKGSVGGAQPFNGKLSELIIENKVWTETERNNYYNASCEYYGQPPIS